MNMGINMRQVGANPARTNALQDDNLRGRFDQMYVGDD